MAVKKVKYSMPRGDSRSLPVNLPVASYTVGSKIFFALKTAVDNVVDDSSAVLRKTLTDANIILNDGVNVHYILSLVPADTFNITPATYVAEFEVVNATQQTVLTFPDPATAIMQFTITGDVNRRTT